MTNKIKNLKIRLATISDIDRIYQIEANIFGKAHWSKNTFKNELTNRDSNYFVAETFNEISQSVDIVGYTGYWKVLNEGHITTMAVHPSYRRNHIADILLYNLILSAQHNNIDWLTLEVKTSNIAAINLYNKFNFKHLGIRKNYYQLDKEDAYIMWTGNLNDSEFNANLKGNILPLLKNICHADK